MWKTAYWINEEVLILEAVILNSPPTGKKIILNIKKFLNIFYMI